MDLQEKVKADKKKTDSTINDETGMDVSRKRDLTSLILNEKLPP